MKISELLSKEIPNLKTSSKAVTDVWPKQQLLGVGAQTIAYLHKKYPDKAVKAIQVTGPDDPSYQFLRLCTKHQDNPYFPKIYSMKYYPSKWRPDNDPDFDDEYSDMSSARLDNTLIVVTEFLQPLPDMTANDLERFDIDDFELPYNLRQHVRRNEIKFRMAFKDPKYRKHMQTYVTDLYLKQALRLLEPLFRHYEADMHGKNIMIRQPNQWVFIDPITSIYLGSD